MQGTRPVQMIRNTQPWNDANKMQARPIRRAGITMHNEGHKNVLGMPVHLEVELSGDAKYQPCQELELISEAVEVIYAFAVGLEPADVSCMHAT